MTMKPWLARALRRALGTAALLVAAESLLHRTFYARPELPAADADRVGYIVVLDDSAAPGKVSQDHAQRYGASVSHVYRAALKGYAAMMSPTAAAVPAPAS